MKYRVEANLTCLSDGTKWGPHVIEFDTEIDTRWTVRDRVKSIQAVLMRPIQKRERLSNPDKFPLVTEWISCQTPLAAEDLNDQFEVVWGNPPE